MDDPDVSAAIAVLERRWQELPAAGAAGAVRALVVRKGDGVHETPPRVRLSVAGGAEGDRWAWGVPPDPEAQLTLIEARVVEVLAGDSETLRHLHGDNLVVDLDLSVEALPVGTRLRAGAVLLEITAKPHAGCHKFRARYGDAALAWVNTREHRPRRLRGVYARVIEDGELAIGEPIRRV